MTEILISSITETNLFTYRDSRHLIFQYLGKITVIVGLAEQSIHTPYGYRHFNVPFPNLYWLFCSTGTLQQFCHMKLMWYQGSTSQPYSWRGLSEQIFQWIFKPWLVELRGILKEIRMHPPKKVFWVQKWLELPIVPSRCIDGAISEKDKLPSGELNESYASLSFGHLSPPSSCDLSSNWGVFEKVFKLDRPCMVDEIHLRRFDGLLVTDLH